VMNSSVKLRQSVSEFREIIRCYIHDMFPYYLLEHIDEMESFAREESWRKGGCTASESTITATESTGSESTASESTASESTASESTASPGRVCGVCESTCVSTMSPTRPPRPSSFTQELLPACCSAQFVDSTGKLYMSDTEGRIRWCDASRFGTTERWRIVRENISLLPHSRTQGMFTAAAVVREKVRIAVDGTGELELWPGFPRFHDVRAIDMESFSRVPGSTVLRVHDSPSSPENRLQIRGKSPRLLDVLGKHRVVLEVSKQMPGAVLEIEYKRMFVMYAT
jgi:hypothetical protein